MSTRAADKTLAGEVVRVGKARWKLVLAIAFAAMLLAWIVAAIQPKRYRASVIAAVAPITEGLSADDVLRGVDVLERRTVIATVAALAATPIVKTQAGAKNYDIHAAVLPNTNLFHVDVEGRDAREAAEVANRIPGILGRQARAMYKYYGVTTVSAAEPPAEPVFPRVGRIVAAGFLLGLVFGYVLAYALDRLPSWRPAAVGTAGA